MKAKHVFEKVLPTVEEGIDVNEKANEVLQKIASSAIKDIPQNNEYIALISVQPDVVKDYYSKVAQYCDELNELFLENEQLMLFPKPIFLFDCTRSYEIFKSAFETIRDEEEISKFIVAYGSNQISVLQLSFYDEFGVWSKVI